MRIWLFSEAIQDTSTQGATLIQLLLDRRTTLARLQFLQWVCIKGVIIFSPTPELHSPLTIHCTSCFAWSLVNPELRHLTFWLKLTHPLCDFCGALSCQWKVDSVTRVGSSKGQRVRMDLKGREESPSISLTPCFSGAHSAILKKTAAPHKDTKRI